jgi:phosphopantothenoylcysteine decarboxylase
MNVLLGVTGSVAATLTPKIQQAIILAGNSVQTIFTKSAENFHDVDDTIYCDEDEWTYYKEENKVLHIDLVKWADIFVIAPCTANTLAKIANGVCDNLLTSCVRAWDWEKNIIIAPAMNTVMYSKSITMQHKRQLYCMGNGFIWIQPVEKTLYCGDTGIGAMADIDSIVERIK